MTWLTDPFGPLYMQRALAETTLLAVPAGALGALVAVRRLAFFSHALGVGTFPGVVVAAGIGVSPFLGGLVASLALAVAMTLLQRRRELDAPAAAGLLLAGAVALGSLLVSDVFGSGASVDRLLFGSLLGVTDGDLLRSVIVAGAAALTVTVAWRGLLACSFDRDTARALGFGPARYDAVLFVALAGTVVAAADAVGALLVSSLILVPAATARLIVGRLAAIALLGAAIAVADSVAGLIVSWHADSPPGATIAAVAAGLFVVVYAIRLARPRRVLLLGAATLLLAAGCGGSVRSADGRLRVVATTPIVADWASIVGGRAVEVTSLLTPVTDPHEFEPGPRAADAVSRARVVLASGAGFDGWITGLRESAGGESTLVTVAPAAGLRPTSGAGEGGDDPHFWHDPRLAVRAVRAIERALAAADPGHARGYEARAAAYRARLLRLDADLGGRFAAVPPADRKLVTDHDAFGYLAARYGLRIVGTAIPSTSTAADASAGSTARLIDAIRRERVRVLFSESSVDPKLIRRIAAATGARVETGLYGDTLGRPGSGAATYLAMMRWNARLILAGLRTVG